MKDRIFNSTIVRILLCFFLIIQVIPPMWVQDVSSMRHFFIALFDIVAVGWMSYVIFRQKAKTASPFAFTPLKVWALLLLWMLVSFLWAINCVESLATWNRWLVVFISCISLIMLLTDNKKVFHTLVYCTMAVALVNILTCIIGYYHFDLHISQRRNLMLSGGYGNKNIFAVSLLFKLPLLYYALLRYKKIWKVISLILIGGCAFCLIILSTRSCFIGLFMQLAVLIIYALASVFYLKKSCKTLLPYALITVFAVAGFMLGNQFIKYNYEHYAAKNVKNFYTIGARVKTIEDGNSKGRLLIWKHTVEIIKMKPLTGYGVGNHKLAIQQVEAPAKMNYVVSDHAHNDYLEMMSELGVVGEILYLLFYATLIFFALKTIIRKQTKEPLRLMALSGMLILLTYMNDAMFNFPLERGADQLYLALAAALIAVSYKASAGKEAKPMKKQAVIALCVIMVPVMYIESLHFASSILQRERIICHNNQNSNGIPPSYWVKHTPWLPNIDESNKPLAINNAMMYALDGDYRTAIDLILPDNTNPHYHLKEYRLASYYSHLGKMDSAFYWADSCIKAKPKCYDAVVVKASYFGRQGDTLTQIRMVEDYLKRETEEPRAYTDLINLYLLKGEKDKAMKVYSAAIEKLPQNAKIQAKKAEIEAWNSAEKE